jgi:hypothetical protein
MKRRIGLSLIVSAVLAASVTQLGAYRPAAAVAPPGTSTVHAAEKVLPLTCLQAWVESGKSYPHLMATVKTLARVSLANRDLTFPNSRDAGLDAGRGIAEDCKADHNALLFAIVDKHVRRVAETASVGTMPPR